MHLDIESYLPIDMLKQLFGALSTHGESRLVGGCVREIIRGNHPKDIDIATQVLPLQAMELLERSGFKCIPTGLKHGTITVTKDGHKFEVTTLRADVATDGRHADVVYTLDWQEDAMRRDFTFNALYLDLDGRLHDYHSGIQDLERCIIRFIGNPERRIHEDYLRILRYFRFYSYYNADNIDSPSLEACQELGSHITKLSCHRIHQELFKMLSAHFGLQAVIIMQATKVLNYLIPGLQLVDLTKIKFTDEPVVNLAALLKLANLNEQQFDQATKFLGLTNREKETVATLLNTIIIDPNATNLKSKEVIYRHGYKNYLLAVKLFNALNPLLETIADHGDIPKFPITGHDLIACGFKSKAIGVELKKLEDLWIKNNFQLTKEELLGPYRHFAI